MRWLQRAMLATSAGPLRRLWAAAYAGAARMIAASLRRGAPRTAVYLGGSLGFGEPLYGISDVDVIAVADGDADALRRRWARLAARLPLLARLAQHVYVYDDDELRAVEAPCLTSAETFLRRDGLHDDAGLAVRPGPFGATRGWRLLAGPERRPPPGRDEQSRRIAAWLELQFWWRFAFEAATRPRALHVPFLCLKLIAEPARLELWLAEERAILRRREVLHAAIERAPEEEAAFRAALELERELPRNPDAPLALALASLTRQSTRIAQLLARAVDEAGTRLVRLVGTDAGPLPLLDWRALVAPARAPESFALVDGDPADPDDLADAARASGPPAPALRAPELLVRPSRDPDRAKLRAVQCAATDPVSFALAGGRDEAAFPELGGWSAGDWARRAVAEHRVWLAKGAPPSANGYTWIEAAPRGDDAGAATRDRLLAAARAALFEQSVGEGEPTLLLSLDAVANRIGADTGDVRALRRAVGELRAYR